mgnify:CR=1 FL=1
MKKTRLLQAILRQNFSSFIEKTFYELNPGLDYTHNWHIEMVSEMLESCVLGDVRRLIINIPPRSLKSIITSVAFPSFILGHDPTKRIITASFSSSLSLKHSLDTRYILESKWYQELFPQTILSKVQNQKSKFSTTRNGFRMAVSVGSMVTGEGADWLIIDDPHNPSHIFSSKRRNQVLNWYEQSFSTRLNNKKTGGVILVMQRLHTDDLSGYLKQLGGFKEITIPAIADRKLYFSCPDNICHQLDKGDIFDKNRFTIEILAKTKQEMGNNNFSAQYLQNPSDLSKGMIDIKDLTFHKKLDIRFDYFVISIDTAIKVGQESDFSALTIWGVRGDCFYLTFLYREKTSYPLLKRKVIYYINKYKPKITLIEDHASGSALIQDLKFDFHENIIPVRQKLDKITRFASIMPLLQSGRVSLLAKDAIMQELAAFPNGRNDDIVDSISQFLSYMKSAKVKNIKIRKI